MNRVSVTAWVHMLSHALLQATTGLYVDPINGTLQQGGVNPAAMWPPHRRPATPARQRRKVKPHVAPSIRSAMRRARKGTL